MTESPAMATSLPAPNVFLTAEWRGLAMLNYEIDPAVLLPFVPRQTELDYFDAKTYVSMVGFLFLNTKVKGVSVPFHRNFEEVNLRFYVRRQAPEGVRRGVVFIKEIVPRRAIAALARALYGENYVALPMRHKVGPAALRYEWKLNENWNHIEAKCEGEALLPSPRSMEEFITEHYWGYARSHDGGAREYQVEHPRWRVRRANDVHLDCDAATLYGSQFTEVLSRPPASAFVAEGSAISVRQGQRI